MRFSLWDSGKLVDSIRSTFSISTVPLSVERELKGDFCQCEKGLKLRTELVNSRGSQRQWNDKYAIYNPFKMSHFFAYSTFRNWQKE